jgi:pimeloyl-ACP methyl ester carboxylesterase
MPKIIVNNIHLYYKELGKSGEVIVFLHGLGATSASWLFQEKYFKEYRLIMPDMRGHGQSEIGEGSLNFTLYASDIKALLDTLGINKVHLCGFSLGGFIAFEFATKYPDMLHSLCIVNAIDEFVLKSNKARFLYFLRKLLFKTLPISIVGKALSNSLFPNSQESNLRKLMMEHLKFVNEQGYLKTLDAMYAWSVRNAIQNIYCKTLIIGSEYDYEVFEGKEELAKRMRNAIFLEIKGAHHFVTRQKADEFNTMYKNFIDS